MSRIWQSGFEQNVIDNGVGEFRTNSNGVVGTSPVHSGTYALGPNVANILSVDSVPGTGITAANVERYIRLYIYLTSLPVATPSQLIVLGNAAVPSFSTVVQISTGGVLQIQDYANGTVGGAGITSGPTLELNRWYRIEAYAKAGTAYSNASGTCTVRLDGAQDFTLSNCLGVTGFGSGGAYSTASYISFGSSSCVAYIDDLAINDVTSAGAANPQNTWCGSGSIFNITPAADGSPTNWTPTGGGAHYTQINDAPTSDTTYIETTSKTANLEDNWTMSDLPSNIPSSCLINALLVGVRGGGDGATTRTAAVKTTINAVSVTATAVDWGLNGWQTVYPAASVHLVSSARFNAGHVNGMSMSAIDTDSSTRTQRWSAVWASVDLTLVSMVPPLRHRQPSFLSRRRYA